ncbi:Leucine-rich_repeat domain superfamily [Hexamita inflata]|uniref:Leucine-rich repeat domain superfamily n=1 Tax=Hexamita inflata TaxID=28002 RepID=A0AA86UUH2_9EUKA|nr:Leucine-rich repeat domain superfamily [Hexamita inflata]
MNDEQLIQQYRKQVHHNQTKTLIIQANRSIQSFKFVDKLMIGNLQIQDCPKIQFTNPPKKVVELQVNYCDFKQLSGIEHMLQLRELSLSTNSIQNIEIQLNQNIEIQYLGVVFRTHLRTKKISRTKSLRKLYARLQRQKSMAYTPLL